MLDRKLSRKMQIKLNSHLKNIAKCQKLIDSIQLDLREEIRRMDKLNRAVEVLKLNREPCPVYGCRGGERLK